jgi:ferric-dicitrate binding protein FerR (iron transport regulator)
MTLFGQCPRWSEVEASADGRLGPREAQDCERHLATCARCREDTARLSALRAQARASAEGLADQLRHRRLRAAVLRAALTAGEPRPSRATLVAIAAAVALILWVIGRGTVSSPSDSRASVPRVLEASVDDLGGGRWERTRDARREVVNLREGAVHITVPHQAPHRRFLVSLPDGELEVRGTRFTVEARGGRTERVVVFEGLVALRIGHGPERLIGSGAQFLARDAAEITATASVDPSDAGASPGSSSLDAAPLARASSSATRAIATQPRALAPVAAGTVEVSAVAPIAGRAPQTQGDDAGRGAFARFAEGVDALGRGDFLRAASEFAEFERERPEDERADDAGWLRVVALRRAGQESSSIDAAERYLRAHPRGSHRADASTLVARAAYVRQDCTRVWAALAEDGARQEASELRRLGALCGTDGGRP